MAKNRMTVDFSGVDSYIQRLQKLPGAAEKAITAALKETQEFIADKAAASMTPHNKTGAVAGTILRDGNVVWTMDAASIAVGFEIADSEGNLTGLPSIFLMYGTEVGGQTGIEADKSMYMAIYGSATKKEVQRIQEKAFDKVFDEFAM
jgi:hypothetical protein